MPNNKRHTLKTIKNREECHPSSRKARQLTRVFLRKERLDQRSTERSNSNPKAERWLWFRYALDESLPIATMKEMHDLVEMYLERNNDELEKLVKDRQIGGRRPKTKRELLLLALIESERAEYKSGFEVPDMTNGKTLKLLRDWDGDNNSMARMQSIRISAPINPIVMDATMESAPKPKNAKTTDAMEE
ncbi:hypothetical protein CLU79DRAFT_767559 [Phycomyces nitens]|nr:hypothetical protein CLU79DRAFT_767559 [Phycomyces nitens]